MDGQKSTSSFAAIFRGDTLTIASRARGRPQAEAYQASETFGEEAINDDCNCFIGVKNLAKLQQQTLRSGALAYPHCSSVISLAFASCRGTAVRGHRSQLHLWTTLRRESPNHPCRTASSHVQVQPLSTVARMANTSQRIVLSAVSSKRINATRMQESK